jgi:glycogen debranching enzyme
VRDAVVATDMLSPWGVRSTSADDERYNNDNVIKPYRCDALS